MASVNIPGASWQPIRLNTYVRDVLPDGYPEEPDDMMQHPCQSPRVLDELQLMLAIANALEILPSNVCNHPGYRALFVQGITCFKTQFVGMDESQIRDKLNYYPEALTWRKTDLQLIHKEDLVAILAYVHYLSRKEGRLIESYEIDHNEFIEWKNSIYDQTKPISKWNVPQDELDPNFNTWRKIMKPDARLFEIFLRPEAFYWHREHVLNKMLWMGLIQLTDMDYVPHDENLHKIQQTWFMDVVLTRCMKEPYSKSLVRKYSKTCDVAMFWNEWNYYFINSVTTENIIADLSTFLTGSRMINTRPGPQTPKLTHWYTEMDRYNDITPPGEGYAESQASQFLRNYVQGVENLEQVWNLAATARAATGVYMELRYPDYKTRLIHAAQTHDKRHDQKGSGTKRIANVHEFSEGEPDQSGDDEIDDDNSVDDDVDEELYTWEAYYNESQKYNKDSKKPFNPPRKSNGQFTRRGPTVRKDIWTSLSDEAQKMWDKIPAADKGKLLNYAKNDRFKDKQTRFANSHETTDADDDDRAKDTTEEDVDEPEENATRKVSMHRRVLINTSEVPMQGSKNVQKKADTSAKEESGAQDKPRKSATYLDLMVSRNFDDKQSETVTAGTYPKNAIIVDESKEEDKKGEKNQVRQSSSASIKKSVRIVNMAKRTSSSKKDDQNDDDDVPGQLQIASYSKSSRGTRAQQD